MWAKLSLAANILIVATGGAVRLTASGLGCPTWPLCTEDSLISTPEMGVHGIIEFGNRLLTFLLAALALLAFLSVQHRRRERPDLFWLALTVGIGIIVQAIVGGITVLLNLHPGAVGIHYMISAALVSVAATLVYRLTHPPGVRRQTTRTAAILTSCLLAATVVTIYLGTLTTGAGPHAGDSAAARNGLDPGVLQHFHAVPGYVMLVLSLVLLGIAIRAPGHASHRRHLGWFVAIEAVQIAVGVAQARLGLPVILVGIHMVIACVLVMLLTWIMLATRQQAPTIEAGEPA